MSFELGHRFIQNWKQLPGYERNQIIGELSDLVTLLSSDELPIKPKHVAAISETQESLFEDLPDNSAWLTPASPKSEPNFEQNANASQPKTPIQSSEPVDAVNVDQPASLDLDTELEQLPNNPALISSDKSRKDLRYHISSDLSAQMMPSIADLEAIEWGDDADEQLIDETFFEAPSQTDALRVQVEQILDHWWNGERERLVQEVLIKLSQP